MGPVAVRAIRWDGEDVTDAILLEGLRFFGYHGITPEERDVGQWFVVDVVAELDLREAGAQDDLAATIDYVSIYGTVRKIVEGEPLTLSEAVAERCARALLETYPRIDAVEIAVRKPAAPIRGAHFDAAGVQIRRVRAYYRVPQSIEIPKPPFLTKGNSR